MTFLFPKPPKPPPIPAPPPPLPPPPQPLDPAITIARTRAKQRANLSSRGQTILTSGLGLTDEATTAKKTILGA
jgi:hypothetical protein